MVRLPAQRRPRHVQHRRMHRLRRQGAGAAADRRGAAGGGRVRGTQRALCDRRRNGVLRPLRAAADGGAAGGTGVRRCRGLGARLGASRHPPAVRPRAGTGLPLRPAARGGAGFSLQLRAPHRPRRLRHQPVVPAHRRALRRRCARRTGSGLRLRPLCRCTRRGRRARCTKQDRRRARLLAGDLLAAAGAGQLQRAQRADLGNLRAARRALSGTAVAAAERHRRRPRHRLGRSAAGRAQRAAAPGQRQRCPRCSG